VVPPDEPLSVGLIRATARIRLGFIPGEASEAATAKRMEERGAAEPITRLLSSVLLGRSDNPAEIRLRDKIELELELIQPHMAHKPVLRGEAGCACVARGVSVEKGGIDPPS